MRRAGQEDPPECAVDIVRIIITGEVARSILDEAARS